MRPSLKTLPKSLLSSYKPNQAIPIKLKPILRQWGLMLPLLLVLAWLGLRGLHADALWYDEWWSVYYAGSAAQYPDVSLADTWGRVAAEFHELNPPGYYMTLNLWSQLAGTQPTVLRAWSLWMSLLAVVLVYRLATDMRGVSAGVVAASLLAFSTFFIRYTHEARAYAQLTMLTVLTVWCYWRLIRAANPPPRFVFVLLWFGVTGLLYTHYMSVMVLGALGLYHLFFVQKNRRWWVITGIVVLAGLLFVPWAVRAIGALQQVDSDSTRDFFALSPLRLLRRTLDQFANGSGLLVVVLAWFGLRHGRYLVWLITVTFVLALVANVQVQFITDAHYMLPLFPLMAVLAGIGVANLRWGHAAIVAIWGIVGIWSAVFPPALDATAWRQYIAWDDLKTSLSTQAVDGERIAFLLPATDPVWIHQPVADFYMMNSPLTVTVLDTPPEKLPWDYENEMRYLVETTDRLWMAYDTRRDYQPDPLALSSRNWMLEIGDMIDCEQTVWAGTLRADLYIPPPEPGWVFPLTDEIGIGSHQWSPRIIGDDFTFFVMTERGAAVPPNTYSVSVQVIGAGEQMVYQADYPLPDEPQACRLIKIPLTEIPTGDYEIYGVIYNWATGERAGRANNPQERRAYLTNLTIEEPTP